MVGQMDGVRSARQVVRLLLEVSEMIEFCIKSDELCIQNDGLCIYK